MTKPELGQKHMSLRHTRTLGNKMSFVPRGESAASTPRYTWLHGGAQPQTDDDWAELNAEIQHDRARRAPRAVHPPPVQPDSDYEYAGSDEEKPVARKPVLTPEMIEAERQRFLLEKAAFIAGYYAANPDLVRPR